MRKTPTSDPLGAKRRTVSHRLSTTGSIQSLREESENSQCPSAEPSVQEPFSPGVLALSLDAVVEENRSDNSSCLLDSGSTMSFASHLPETPSKTTTSLVSIDEAGEHSTSGRPCSPPQATAFESPHHSQEREPPPSKTASTQTPISSHLAESPRGLIRSASAQSCPLATKHESSFPVTDISGPPTLNKPASPKNERGDDYVTAAAGSRWNVKIVPVPRSPGPGSSPPTPPAFVKLEAVFPYRHFADNNAASSPAWTSSSEDSYIIIGRPAKDLRLGGSRLQDHGRGPQDVREKSRQEYIDEWDDYATELLDADDAE